MIHIAREGDISLHFYAPEFCVLVRYDGAKRLVEGPLAALLRKLTDSIGIRGIRRLLSEEIPLPSDGVIVRDKIRDLFNGLDVVHRGDIGTLMKGSTGKFSTYCVQHRIPLLGMCEITYRCNLRCQHCYILHKVNEKRPAHADTRSVANIIQSMVKLGCLDLTLTGGESTLHKDYLAFVKAAKEAHLYTILKTNGTTFTRSMAEKYAVDPAHETDLSLYGATPTVHDTFTDVPGSFEKTMRGMHELARVGIRCNVNCVVWEGNANELDDIEQVVNDHGHRVVFDDLIYGRLNGDRFPLSLRIRPETRARLISDGRLKPFTPSPCIAGQMKVKVDAEGNVSTCELLPQGFGNAFAIPLEEVWRSRDVVDFSESIVAMSASERDGKSVVLSCPGLNVLNTGQFHGRTSV